MKKGDWRLVIDVDRSASLPPFLQIARALTDDIRRGRLRPGDRLPGSRDLADAAGVHRNTILSAYGELVAEGWLEAAHGRGTFVAHTIPESRARDTTGARTRSEAPKRAGFAVPSGPEVYRPAALPRGTLNLSSGAPDPRLVPARAIGRAYRRVLARRAGLVLSYGDPEGHPALRSALASMLAVTRALPIGPEDVLVTRGSQMALSLVARTLLRPGDVVAVERLGYRPAWEAFRAAGARVVSVAIDDEGIDVAALAALHDRTPIRAVYLTPHHQYPTTVTLTASRRLEILALARRERLAIVEDDYDHEFHYEGRPVLPLASADPARVVIYVGTLSKVLAPGLRLGYVVAPPDVMQRITAIRSLLDIQGDLAMEAAIAALIDDNELQRHVARARRIYAERRKILADAIRRELGDAAEFRIPSGGMALWVRFTSPENVELWARRSADRGVWWYTGRRYAFDQKPIPFARFSFAWLNERELPEAVRRLVAARPAVRR
ncbi:MAG TPA: PLP-dependent aminotransferase family protein [Vicinamibacterales bacterium]|nr:PLP-dependent aminotransferase family protein [Vicinamibacterales bacterium]